MSSKHRVVDSVTSRIIHICGITGVGNPILNCTIALTCSFNFYWKSYIFSIPSFPLQFFTISFKKISVFWKISFFIHINQSTKVVPFFKKLTKFKLFKLMSKLSKLKKEMITFKKLNIFTRKDSSSTCILFYLAGTQTPNTKICDYFSRNASLCTLYNP